MKRASILLQIALFIGGLIALFFYVYPEIMSVNENQNLTQEYSVAIEEAEELRTVLSDLQQEMQSIPDSEMMALERYLTTEPVDQISIQRDIYAYVQARNLFLEDLTHSDDTETDFDSGLQTELFEITVRGDYSDIKAFMTDLERNDYPLRIQELSLAPDEIGFIIGTFMVETYQFIGLEDRM